MTTRGLTFIVCTRDAARLNRLLLPSLLSQMDAEMRPCPGEPFEINGTTAELKVCWNADSLTRAYDDAEQAARFDTIVTLHDDCDLPPGWVATLRATLDRLDQLDPTWAVFGTFGTFLGAHGQDYVGDVHDLIGTPYEVRRVFHPEWGPTRVRTVDGQCVVKRREAASSAASRADGSPVRWDRALPCSFAGGSTEDLCLQAHAAGRGVWAAPIPLRHHGTAHDLTTDAAYRTAKEYVMAKWPGVRPIVTTAGVWW